MPVPQPRLTDAGMEPLSAPLYAAWQLTNACNLSCLHCIEESGPDKAFKDELGREQALRVLDQLVEAQVPYVSFSGGEPMLRSDFFELAEYAVSKGLELKIETNGHYLTPESCSRLKALDAAAVQVSLDGVTPSSYNKLRARASFEKALEGLRNLKQAGVPREVNFVPTRFNIHEAEQAVDLAWEHGACGFYTGKIMYTGNAVKAWELLQPSQEQYARFFETLRSKAGAYEGRMRVCYHEMGLLEELRYRLVHPAALFIILPNGKVKLINALPFVCGDLRVQPLAEVWKNFQDAWKDPRVARFVEEMGKDPAAVSRLHQWIDLQEPVTEAA